MSLLLQWRIRLQMQLRRTMRKMGNGVKNFVFILNLNCVAFLTDYFSWKNFLKFKDHHLVLWCVTFQLIFLRSISSRIFAWSLGVGLKILTVQDAIRRTKNRPVSKLYSNYVYYIDHISAFYIYILYVYNHIIIIIFHLVECNVIDTGIVSFSSSQTQTSVFPDLLSIVRRLISLLQSDFSSYFCI